MAGISSSLPEQRIGSVESVQDPQNTEAVVEFEVVEIVGLVAGEKWQMVARVCVQSVANGQSEPEPA